MSRRNRQAILRSLAEEENVEPVIEESVSQISISSESEPEETKEISLEESMVVESSEETKEKSKKKIPPKKKVTKTTE